MAPVLIINNRCVFKKDLTKICRKLGVKLITLTQTNKNQKNPWIRDHLFFTAKGDILIFGKQETLWMERVRDKDTLNEFNLKHIPEFINNLSQSDYAEKSKELKTLGTGAIIRTNRPIEPGNIISAYNREGKLFYIISADIKNIEENIINTHKKDQDPEYQPKTATQRYAEKFGANEDQILFVPHLPYHLDLSITDLGNGIILINDLDEAKKHFVDQAPLLSNTDLLTKHRALVDDTIQILKQNGFKPVKSASTLFNPIYNISEEDIVSGIKMKSTFANSILIESSDGSKNLVTMKSTNSEHIKYFEELVREVTNGNTKVFFADLDIQTKTLHKTTAAYASTFRGGIRCQSNQPSGNCTTPPVAFNKVESKLSGKSTNDTDNELSTRMNSLFCCF